MLPPQNRMRRSREFTAVLRGGVRARGERLVVHHLADAATSAPVVGFVVGRPVGNSVARHRVTRRLRAQVAIRLAELPAGSATVVRALPRAAEATSAELGVALDRALARLARTR